MSTFQVKLQNVQQGLLDLDPSTWVAGAPYGQLGTPFTTSKQRQIFVAGPRRTYRLLSDGETFSDCNYWKRFAYPQVGREFAFIEVVTDDGSIYSDIPAENTFAAGGTVTTSSSFSDNDINFVTTYGGAASMLMVQNLNGSSKKVVGELNGDTNVTFTLAAGATQIFNAGDLAITRLRLKQFSDGTPQASWIASIRSVPTS